MRLKPNGVWFETKLIAAGQEQIIYFREGMEFSGHKNNYEFRPAPSPEDVVRDEAIAKIISILNEGTSTQDDARDIYDAIAESKIPGITLSSK